MSNRLLHAHVSTSARDCDGPLYRDYVETMNPEEMAMQVRAYFNGIMLGYDQPVNDFSEYAFKERMLGSAVSFHSESEVHVFPEGFRYHEVTDEGYTAREVRWCEDVCDTSLYHYRDVYAEQMGY